MRLKLSTNEEGYITNVSTYRGDTEIPDAIVTQIIVGVSKLVDGVIYYRVSALTDDDGYMIEYGTDPAGDMVVPAEELQTAVPGATKYASGHLVVDQAKAASLASEMATDTPTTDADLASQVADLKTQLAQANQAAQQAQEATMELADVVLNKTGSNES